MRGVVNARADGNRLTFGGRLRGGQGNGGGVTIIAYRDRGRTGGVEGFEVAPLSAVNAQRQRFVALLVGIVITAVERHAAGGLAHGDGDLLAVAEGNHQRAALRGVVNARADGNRLTFGGLLRNAKCNSARQARCRFRRRL